MHFLGLSLSLNRMFGVPSMYQKNDNYSDWSFYPNHASAVEVLVERGKPQKQPRVSMILRIKVAPL